MTEREKMRAALLRDVDDEALDAFLAAFPSAGGQAAPYWGRLRLLRNLLRDDRQLAASEARLAELQKGRKAAGSG